MEYFATGSIIDLYLLGLLEFSLMKFKLLAFFIPPYLFNSLIIKKLGIFVSSFKFHRDIKAGIILLMQNLPILVFRLKLNTFIGSPF